jgi:hypothetical protein
LELDLKPSKWCSHFEGGGGASPIRLRLLASIMPIRYSIGQDQALEVEAQAKRRRGIEVSENTWQGSTSSSWVRVAQHVEGALNGADQHLVVVMRPSLRDVVCLDLVRDAEGVPRSVQETMRCQPSNPRRSTSGIFDASQSGLGTGLVISPHQEGCFSPCHGPTMGEDRALLARSRPVGRWRQSNRRNISAGVEI